MLGIPDVSRTHSEDLLCPAVEASHMVGHRFHPISLVCILNTKGLFSFSESHFCRRCCSEVAALMGSENTLK